MIHILHELNETQKVGDMSKVMRLMNVSVSFEKGIMYIMTARQANTASIVFPLNSIKRIMMVNFRLILGAGGGALAILHFFVKGMFIFIVTSCIAS